MQTPGFLVLAADSGGHGRMLLDLFIILLAAKLMAELFERLRQPAVIGEILAGIIIGPGLLGWIHPAEVTDALAEIGVVFLLFTVGLETRPGDIFKVGGRAAVVAVLGAMLPFAVGWGLLSVWPGHSTIEALFLGSAMVATSVGITARVLSGMGLIDADATRVILAAAVIDDIIGLLVLAVVSSMATGQVDYTQISITAIMAVVFTVLIVTLGARTVNRVKEPVSNLRINHSLLLFALVICFGFAALASVIGIAGIVGAFLAGVAISEATDGTDLHNQAQTLTEFTIPFFLVSIGMKLNLSVFSSGMTILLAVVVTVLAIITKLAGCGAGAWGLGFRKVLQIGVGMIPRGEVGIVVAQIGLGLAAVKDEIYAVVLAMAVATTLAAPPLIKMTFQGEAGAGVDEELERDLR